MIVSDGIWPSLQFEASKANGQTDKNVVDGPEREWHRGAQLVCLAQGGDCFLPRAIWKCTTWFSATHTKLFAQNNQPAAPFGQTLHSLARHALARTRPKDFPGPIWPAGWTLLALGYRIINKLECVRGWKVSEKKNGCLGYFPVWKILDEWETQV